MAKRTKKTHPERAVLKGSGGEYVVTKVQMLFETTKLLAKKFLKLFEATIENYLTDESNVFASSRMVGNAEVAPVDTVAPDAPSDTTEVGTPIQPQATTEDSIQQENTQEETTMQQESAETEQQANAE
mgnify:CR=1 FL=1